MSRIPPRIAGKEDIAPAGQRPQPSLHKAKSNVQLATHRTPLQENSNARHERAMSNEGFISAGSDTEASALSLGPRMKKLSPAPWDMDKQAAGAPSSKLLASPFSAGKPKARHTGLKAILTKSDDGHSQDDTTNCSTPKSPSAKSVKSSRSRKNSMASLSDAGHSHLTTCADAPPVPLLRESKYVSPSGARPEDKSLSPFFAPTASPTPSAAVSHRTISEPPSPAPLPSPSLQPAPLPAYEMPSSPIGSVMPSTTQTVPTFKLISLHDAQALARDKAAAAVAARKAANPDWDDAAPLDAFSGDENAITRGSAPSKATKAHRKTGFLGMFKSKADEDDISSWPKLNINSPPSPKPFPELALPAISEPVSQSPAQLSPPVLLSPGGTTSLEPPSLTLRPVSMFSASTSFGLYLDENRADGIAEESELPSPALSGQDELLPSPSTAASSLGPSSIQSFEVKKPSSSTDPAVMALYEQILKARSSWRSQMKVLETQVDSLTTEVTRLRQEKSSPQLCKHCHADL
ncbi:uncharacterized protein L969DRAFT_90260 [Mixia osmundae IAM 14324]|uniref:Uncharacterized protein n=1 Tax=Mixia osmundae (strain CBS 9802 / IAM 14324 / JCM 22182 / KY 12970) TaxID=764103 RepID=G7DZK9_MIXOS|nr:uncharacterized protein L969DRAFT_90260 [Mixia osmundae IAM 14324]KEI37182.1 hypothetical protein L969DRAFT_90260 [Mixia osmundae IAM 14324]GAA96019.1 hypothetical protein E5Q_02679 [Mixia osmundae IAM 14324]